MAGPRFPFEAAASPQGPGGVQPESCTIPVADRRVINVFSVPRKAPIRRRSVAAARAGSVTIVSSKESCVRRVDGRSARRSKWPCSAGHARGVRAARRVRSPAHTDQLHEFGGEELRQGLRITGTHRRRHECRRRLHLRLQQDQGNGEVQRVQEDQQRSLRRSRDHYRSRCSASSRTAPSRPSRPV